MDTLSKKPRSKTRKTVSALAKVSLVLMGEPIPASSEKIVSTRKQLRQKNRPLFLRILFFIIKMPLLVFISGSNTKHQEDDSQPRANSGGYRPYEPYRPYDGY